MSGCSFGEAGAPSCCSFGDEGAHSRLCAAMLCDFWIGKLAEGGVSWGGDFAWAAPIKYDDASNQPHSIVAQQVLALRVVTCSCNRPPRVECASGPRDPTPATVGPLSTGSPYGAATDKPPHDQAVSTNTNKHAEYHRSHMTAVYHLGGICFQRHQVAQLAHVVHFL